MQHLKNIKHQIYWRHDIRYSSFFATDCKFSLSNIWLFIEFLKEVLILWLLVRIEILDHKLLFSCFLVLCVLGFTMGSSNSDGTESQSLMSDPRCWIPDVESQTSDLGSELEIVHLCWNWINVPEAKTPVASAVNMDDITLDLFTFTFHIARMMSGWFWGKSGYQDDMIVYVKADWWYRVFFFFTGTPLS